MEAIQFYIERKKTAENLLKQLKRSSLMWAMLRLVFFSGIVGVFFLGIQEKFAFGLALCFLLIFFAALKKSLAVKRKRDETKIAVEYFQNELNYLNGDFKRDNNGKDFIIQDHFYSHDIDLLGEGSLFERIDRTALEGGRKKLAELLLENSIDGIPQRQETIKELANEVDWRLDFQFKAAFVQEEEKVNAAIEWMKNYTPKLPRFTGLIGISWIIISLGVIVSWFLGFLASGHFIIAGVVGLFITGVFIKAIGKISREIGSLALTIQAYAELIQKIEEKNFSSDILKNHQKQLKNELHTSVQIKKLSELVNALDQGANVVVSIPLNAYTLWSLRYAFRIEKWVLDNRGLLEQSFQVISKTDAYNSLGNFVFNHPEYVFPDLVSDKQINAVGLTHPLLKGNAVSNNIEMDTNDFFIVTGANMAGKSTFLRTLGLSFVMANVGLPVRAQSMQYQPVKLISSMRTNDSLQKDESYFFSELKRLKFIVDALAKDRYFILLDEILKGTNSKDKAEGSKQFVRRLTTSGSCGVIATHDLSLCELSNEINSCKNYFFEAEIKNDELYFDYKFKAGICQNMNASFLLRKLEIV